MSRWDGSTVLNLQPSPSEVASTLGAYGPTNNHHNRYYGQSNLSWQFRWGTHNTATSSWTAILPCLKLPHPLSTSPLL